MRYIRAAYPPFRNSFDLVPEPSATDYLTQARNAVADYLTPSIRLGVTGLARSGKTVFITALVRNLMSGGRLPFFPAEAEGRIIRAYLEPQPDDSVPRFDYERHLDDLMAAAPKWPDSTRRISELRVTIEYQSASTLKALFGVSKLHLDIVDYPGEWLIDLALLDEDFASFSRQALDHARSLAGEAHVAPFLAFISDLDPMAAEDEQIALEGARLFTAYLAGCRTSATPATLPPGRFLLPGDLAGSPLVTFFPLPLVQDQTIARGSLAAMMERRYQSYLKDVVKPFFHEHFSALDRQIVLVDVLGALDAGPPAVRELERAMSAVLKAFRPGANSWLSMILGRRIERILFAATKADHLPSSSHDRLGTLLQRIIERSAARSTEAGADIAAMALAAVRATREASVTQRGETLPCLRGIPLKGERVDDQVFDGVREIAVFPGDLPADPNVLLSAADNNINDAGTLSLVRFRPPDLKPSDAIPADRRTLPHIRLDRALDFLISDHLT